MAFSQTVIDQAWKRSGGMCECRRSKHEHGTRCGKTLSYANRGKTGQWGCWEAHHITAVDAGGDDTLSNCEILCCDCHAKTETYGG
jgi:hypothetical protein